MIKDWNVSSSRCGVHVVIYSNSGSTFALLSSKQNGSCARTHSNFSTRGTRAISVGCAGCILHL
eukprot:3376294-Rhodomonas_salina.1